MRALPERAVRALPERAVRALYDLYAIARAPVNGPGLLALFPPLGYQSENALPSRPLCPERYQEGR